MDNGWEPEEDTTDDVNPKLGFDTDLKENGQWGQEERCVLVGDNKVRIRKRTQNAPDNLFTIHDLVERIEVEVFLISTKRLPCSHCTSTSGIIQCELVKARRAAWT